MKLFNSLFKCITLVGSNLKTGKFVNFYNSKNIENTLRAFT